MNKEAWRIAKKIARRKYTYWKPISVDEGGVTVWGLIYGNTWKINFQELKQLEASKF